MPQAVVRTITLKAFRRAGQFSGEVRVIAGSRTRRGARWQRGQAGCNPSELAGADAASFAGAGSSAHTSTAHAANPGTGAGLAKPVAKESKRAPKQKKPRPRKPAQKQKLNPAEKKKAKAREDKKKQEEKKLKGSAKSGGSGKGGDDTIPSVWEERACLDGGLALPDTLAEFVNKVNARIDLVRVTELLLRSPDDKAARGLAERLLEAKYGKSARTELANFFGVNAASHADSHSDQA